MKRTEYIEGLSEHCKSRGKDCTDEMLKTANLVYDGLQILVSMGLSEEEAYRKYVREHERILNGGVEVALAIAREGAEVLDKLDLLEAGLAKDDPEIQRELGSLRSDVQARIDDALQAAHDIAATGIHAPRRLGQK